MINSTEILRGHLEGCILSIISKEECYGYIILEKLHNYGFSHLQESTVYPILKRLEKRGLFNISRKKSTIGPPRKYYTLNEKGKEELVNFIRIWKSTQSIINLIIKEV